MLFVAGAGVLFGLCRAIVNVFGAGGLALGLGLLAWISTMFLIAVVPVLFCELIVYVIDQVLRRLKDG